MRMVNKKLSAAWTTWREQAAEATGESSKMREVVGKLLYGQVARAFCFWRQIIAAEDSQLQAMRMVVMKFLDKARSQAFSSWRGQTADVKEQLQLLRQAGMRFVVKNVCAAFAKWREQAAESKHHSTKMRQVIGRLLYAKVARVFISWREIALELVASVANMRRAMYMLVRGSFARAWNLWRYQAQEQAAAHDALRRACIYLVQGSLARYFFEWSSFAAQSILAETASNASGRKAFLAFRNRHLRAAMNTWREAASDATIGSKTLKEAAVRFKLQQLSVAFFTWSSNVIEQILQAEVCARLNAIRMNQKMVRMFDEWQRSAADEAAMQVMLDQAQEWGLRKWTSSNLWGSFSSWLKRTRSISLALLACYEGRMRPTLRSWRRIAAFSITRAQARSQMSVRVDVVMKIRSARLRTRTIAVVRYFERWVGLVHESMSVVQPLITARISLGAKICQAMLRAAALRGKSFAMELWKYRLMTSWVKAKAMLLPLEHTAGTSLNMYQLPWPGL